MVKISVFLCLLVSVCLSVRASEEVKEMDQEVKETKEPEKKPDLKIEVVSLPEKGCDKDARKSQRLDILSMKYTGFLENGTKFESTDDHNQEFSFQLGVGQVIQGWERGMLDMCVGEKRKLTVPPHLAYGDIGAGEKIPPASTLIFECELVKIDNGPKPTNVFNEIDADKDGFITRKEVSEFLIKHSEDKIEPESEEHQKVLDNIFLHEDKDKDGQISKEEFSGPKHDEL
ncbi:peptidyl-prolyl cis-trans isomerase FKBP2-like [Mytilus trossulus]|uniref:peptidyl-prolyl cis-trans isomerase FKBP2-like n=1 Tax=Mytilus trossulus TaxID=6551 RepID=UPI003006550A